MLFQSWVLFKIILVDKCWAINSVRSGFTYMAYHLISQLAVKDPNLTKREKLGKAENPVAIW